MKPETKIQLSQLTLRLLCLMVFGFIVGVLVLVLCAGFQINPFRETTTSLLVSAFVGSIGLSAMLVLLNVTINISLIADSRISLAADHKAGSLRGWYVATIVMVAGIVALIFAGTYMSKDKYIQVVRSQADEVLKDNSPMLDEIGADLSSAKPKDYKRIAEILNFLQNQRSQLPAVRVIYSGKFDDKLALYDLNPNSVNVDLEKNRFEPSYYACDRNVDCEYLKSFFSGQPKDVLQKTKLQSDEFSIYVPIIGKDSRYVLFFERYNRYGKLGSY